MESIDLFKLPPRVFISYSHADREFVEQLAHDLARNRIIAWWDEWEIRVGDSLIQKIESGITSASYLAIVLSSSSVASTWVQEELRAALNRQLSEKRTVVLPVLLNDCEIPLFLRDKRYADFREDYALGIKNLIRAIARPDVGIQGREKLKEYFNDYAIDWFKQHGLYGFKIEITSHSPRLPYSINANITAMTNERLTARFEQYSAAGFSWAIPSMLLGQVSGALSAKPPIIYIDGDHLAVEKFRVFDPRLGIGTDIYVEARRLGDDSGDDILYEWATTFLYILVKHKEKVQAVIPQEDITNFIKWCIVNPAESV